MKESKNDYALKIKFNDIEELIEFFCMFNDKGIQKILKDINKIENKVKKEDDKRGSKTYLLHQKAKEYKSSHPEIPYKQCLKNVSKNKINDNNI